MPGIILICSFHTSYSTGFGVCMKLGWIRKLKKIEEMSVKLLSICGKNAPMMKTKGQHWEDFTG